MTAAPAPASYDELAASLAKASAAGATVRIRGGGTKYDWGRPAPEPDVELSTAALDRVVEHNEGDLTAVLQAGVPLVEAQRRFARAGQMLALDPPLGAGERATVGGVIATADSGPLRHRHGAARDLVLGVTVALADGSLARAGGRVIKNVAGYDLGKLFAGSFGTLGAIVEVAVRLHPIPARRVTALGTSDRPDRLAQAAQALAHAPLEAACLDVAWAGGGGAVLARFGGAAAPAAGQEAASLLATHGLDTDIVDDDSALWSDQREAQRAAAGAVLRVSGLQAGLERMIAAAERHGGSLVTRAALGVGWIKLPDAGTVAALRSELEPWSCVVLDAPAEQRADAWGVPADALARRLKQRFDPGGTLAPGVFLEGV